jgi:hypothetical protein
MKTMLKVIALSAVSTTLMFLLFAFAMWDMNPGNWSEATRVLCATLQCVVAAMSALVVGVLK